MKARTCIQQNAFKFVCIPDPLDTLVSLDTYIAWVGDIATVSYDLDRMCASTEQVLKQALTPHD